MVISGYHNQKKTVLCSFVLIHKENEIIFNALFTYLKENYSFPLEIWCMILVWAN